MRVVPISCLVGSDPSLAAALELAVWPKSAAPEALPKVSGFFKAALTRLKGGKS